MESIKQYIAKRKKRLLENWDHFICKHILPSKYNQIFLKRKKGYCKYTIISACYNVEAYIDEFIRSIINQRLDFKNNIFLVCVDDGSTDSTPDIINHYCKLYPNNITYIRKENGGQASARNLGMTYAKTEWVTFTDPDDFIDYNGLYTIDKALEKNSNVAMLVMNQVFYFEHNKSISRSHPLSYRFSKDYNLIPANNMGDNIHLHAASTFFKRSILAKHNIEMPTNIKPNFEDGHYVAMYLSKIQQNNVVFLKNAIYYYRKRAANNSTLDKSWTDKRKFYDIFKHGYLPMLKYYIENNIGNGYAQRVFLYDFKWHIQHLVDNPERSFFLTNFERKDYIKLIRECFEYVDHTYIENQKIWWFWKYGMLSCFKKEEPTSLFAYIDMYDFTKKEARIRFYCSHEMFEYFTINGKEVIPTWAKTISHDFCGENFLLERILWIPWESGNLNFFAEDKLVSIMIEDKFYGASVNIDTIKKHFKINRKLDKNSPYYNCWIIMDRELYADDNAEHLYRYIAKQHPETPIWFALMKESKDWIRLETEGFRLLEFGSDEHKKALCHCSKIISSQADRCVTETFGTGFLKDKPFVFLQHGVIKDDLSRWLNSKTRIDLFVTTTTPEYNSIICSSSNYRYFAKEVKLTGLPRYDALLHKNKADKKILIMPTWRSYIVGSPKAGGVIRYKNQEFMKTEYAIFWKSFLTSNNLYLLHKKYGYDVIFYPHPLVRDYINDFNLPEFIIIPHQDTSYQDLFQTASLLITDYSSVAFDVAFLEKAIIYYQFDEKTFFSGAHSYRKGYFDYRLDGFGPVVTEEAQLFREIETILQNEGNPSSEYLERMKNTFPFRDGKNCERTYLSIVDLDKPYQSDWVNEEILLDYIDRAQKAGLEMVAKKRAALLQSLPR